MNPLDFLTAIGNLVMTSNALFDSWINLKDRKDRENDIMVKDLCDLLDELRKTLAFCVKLVSPLRHMSDNPQTFANDFKNVYNDFRDNYDMYELFHN